MSLTKEEKEILDAFEKGNLKSVPGVREEKGRYGKYAKNTLQKKVLSHIFWKNIAK